MLAEEAQKAREGLKQAVNILLERDPYAFDEALLVKLAGIWDGDTYSAFIQRLEGYLADRKAENQRLPGHSRCITTISGVIGFIWSVEKTKSITVEVLILPGKWSGEWLTSDMCAVLSDLLGRAYEKET